MLINLFKNAWHVVNTWKYSSTAPLHYCTLSKLTNAYNTRDLHEKQRHDALQNETRATEKIVPSSVWNNVYIGNQVQTKNTNEFNYFTFWGWIYFRKLIIYKHDKKREISARMQCDITFQTGAEARIRISSHLNRLKFRSGRWTECLVRR